jgi:bis(5'-adenosyl)-triphosphatase
MEHIFFSRFEVTSQVFHRSPLSFAFVNLKPLLPGHVLVSPYRVVQRFSDMTEEEVADLFVTVHRVSRMLERVYGASAMNIPLQDGFDAGQSVSHVHIHIVPRKPQDLDHLGGSDAIYDLLEGPEGDLGVTFATRHRPRQPKVDEDSLEPRSDIVMAREADTLRKEMSVSGFDSTKLKNLPLEGSL